MFLSYPAACFRLEVKQQKINELEENVRATETKLALLLRYL